MDLLEEVERLQGFGVCRLGTALLGKGGYVYVACCFFMPLLFFFFMYDLRLQLSVFYIYQNIF